jgi:streptogramin lyase
MGGTNGSASSNYGAGSSSIATATTLADGSFSIALPLTCPTGFATAQTYIVARGGNAGQGANSAIGLLALSGPCNGLSSSSFVTVNELTTAAAAWALAQFSDATGQTVGAPATNTTGLLNAISLATGDLAISLGTNSSDTGIPASFMPTAAQCSGASAPVNCGALEKLDTLANVLAACVESAGPPSAQCQQLFCGATLGAAWTGSSCSETPAPTDTLFAAHQVATNPASNVSTIFAVQEASPPFQPSLGSTPTDWTLALNFVGGGLSDPGSVAIDGQGNAWVADQANAIIELGPTGKPISPSTGFTGGGLNSPSGIAIDPSLNVWVTNFGNNSVSEYVPGKGFNGSGFAGGGLNEPVAIAFNATGSFWVAGYISGISEFNSSGSPVFGPSTGGGLSGANAIAIDASGNIWVANNANSSLSGFNSSGNALSGSPFSGGGLNSPWALAIDASGNIWVANAGNNSLSGFTSSGSAFSPKTTGYTGGGLNGPRALAIDGSGNIWVSNFASESGNSVSEFNSSTGLAISPSTGYTGGGLAAPLGIAIDGSGNVWVANFGNGGGTGSVSTFIGAARPVKTPLVAAFGDCGKTVCLP